MATDKESRLLRVGVLGCGPIAQIAHFDACRKARNVELYAICDIAADLRDRMQVVWEPRVVYADYSQMLADTKVEAVIIAVADQFHAELAIQAVEAGKHILIEKPLGVTIEECERLRDKVRQLGVVAQVGNNRRFDPGVRFAKEFIDAELGRRFSLKAWYHDSVYRYTMTDNLQPVVLQSEVARRPQGNPKSDRRRYYLLGHASHLVDTARLLGGEIVSVQARMLERDNTHCWFINTAMSDGSLGHLDLTIAVRGDFDEGFFVGGSEGSVRGSLYLPWYHKSSFVECFSAKDRLFRRPLGEDAYSYKLQLESFADTILQGTSQVGATVSDGIAALRAIVAISRSIDSGQQVYLNEVTGTLQ